MNYSKLWWSLLFNDWYDIFVAIMAVVGLALLVYQLYLYDWDIEAFMFDEIDE